MCFVSDTISGALDLHAYFLCKPKMVDMSFRNKLTIARLEPSQHKSDDLWWHGFISLTTQHALIIVDIFRGVSPISLTFHLVYPTVSLKSRITHYFLSFEKSNKEKINSTCVSALVFGKKNWSRNERYPKSRETNCTTAQGWIIKTDTGWGI